MTKIGTIIILSIIIISLPWIGFLIWDLFPPYFKINSITLRNVVNVLFGILIGVVIFNKRVKITIIPVLLILFIASDILWSVNRFNSNKHDLSINAIEYPQTLPDCMKETNFESLWHYMSNGCHFTTEEFIGRIVDRILILTIAILLGRILINIIRKKNKKRTDPSIIDTIEE